MFMGNTYKKILFLLIIAITISLLACSGGGGEDTENPVSPPPLPSQTTGNGLTVMIYLDGDNNLEEAAMSDVEEMKSGILNNGDLNIIVLVDRINGYSDDSSAFGENFEGTRLYRISERLTTRLSDNTYLNLSSTGDLDELNMGDANTLKNFVKFCKNKYPAEKYALIMWNHGGGVRSKNRDPKITKDICWDETDGEDCLYTAEITDILSESESVDLLAFDACLMGSVEVAYQFRPGNGSFYSRFIVASAPSVDWDGYNYQFIFSRIKSGGGTNGQTVTVAGSGYEKYYDPLTISPLQLAEILVEEQYDSTRNPGLSQTESLSCYDLTKVGEVKTAVDNLAKQLVTGDYKNDFEEIRGSVTNVDTIHYFYENYEEDWVYCPYFDLYDLCDRIAASTDKFNANIRSYAETVQGKVDEMIVYSFGGTDYKGFSNGVNGVYIFAPDGDRIYNTTTDDHYVYQRWYTSLDTSSNYTSKYLYGKLLWCADGATAGNGSYENWYEMLEYWFDSDGTHNLYNP